MMTARGALTALALCATAACGSPAERVRPTSMNAVAEGYVKLVLAVGQHDAAYVDAYYGPPEWKVQTEQRKGPLAEIDAEAIRLIEAVGSPAARANPDDLAVLRQVYLRRQLEALRARVRM